MLVHSIHKIQRFVMNHPVLCRERPFTLLRGSRGARRQKAGNQIAQANQRQKADAAKQFFAIFVNHDQTLIPFPARTPPNSALFWALFP